VWRYDRADETKIQCEPKNTPLGFLTFFPNGWELGICSPNFTRLLCVPIYTRLQIFIQLSATLTKLCHIKCDQPVPIICSMSTISRNARVQNYCLRKSLIPLLIVVCGKSSQICCNALFSSGMVFGFDWSCEILKYHTTHMVVVVEWVEWGLVSLVDIGPLRNLSS